ncbi:MAG: DNA-processing protein DprA [Gammaproteobacteria bacterium]|nr:DNA-processing protein DprA [Gammaproteobacteria bacterium]
MDDTRPPAGDDLKYWLALAHIPGLGDIRVGRILEDAGEPRSIFDEPDRYAQRLGLGEAALSWLKRPRWEAIETSLRWVEQANHHIVTRRDPRYPRLLEQIANPPALLYVHGDPELLSSAQLAVVGTRSPSHSGRLTAREFCAHLASLGITITSGMAAGIDGASHEGALDAGGYTIAVAATGLDRVYPAHHRNLAHRITRRGAVISEFPPGTPVAKYNFPRRNRIISGLSMGTLVVEAAGTSGSLITAREAAEQGREVFAIPGSIHNPLSRGCHRLIREGAKLVETASDIIEELGPLLPLPPAQRGRQTVNSQDSPTWDQDYQRLLAAMEYDPLHLDILIHRSGLTADAVSSMLLLLELEGHVSSVPGGRYCLTRPSGQSASNRHSGENRQPPGQKVCT